MGSESTSGTGADCTAFAIINDEELVYKLILVVPGVAPSVGISEPAFMRLQPPQIVAWTGMDAFCHAMEPFIGRLNLPLSHATSLRAIKLLSENLRQGYANPKNDVAIENLISVLLGRAPGKDAASHVERPSCFYQNTFTRIRWRPSIQFLLDHRPL